MEKYNINDAEAVEIRKKLEYLCSLDNNRFGICLFDVISIEDVRKFEAEHDIKLPDDYVWFITNVGNGGKWRDGYYFYSLEETYFSCEGLPDFVSGQEKYALDVLSLGCSYSFGIILKGEHFGEISDDGDGDAYYNNDLQVKSFKELYIKWLNEACLQYNGYGFERRLSGTIEENLKEYEKSHDRFALFSVYSKINRRVCSEQLITQLYNLFNIESDNKIKMFLAEILIKAGYSDVFSLLKGAFVPENYSDIAFEIYNSLNYFPKRFEFSKVMKDAKKYYPMLVKMLKNYQYFVENNKFDDYRFGRCFEMTVMNPRFNQNDIMDILTSDDKDIITFMSVSIYDKNILERVGKYVEEAKIKYKKITEVNNYGKDMGTAL